MDSTKELRKRDFAETLARGLACLEVLADATAPSGCSEVATAMGVSRTAARRILLTRVHSGYVAEDRGEYRASPKGLSLKRGMLAKGSL
ncbi:IclR family regulatory protein [Burkholderia lata]|uniref:IclR family regulatory protein n=2 Tax=Burkholderia lata (strain ATCC 17760 / DSM 23089 / LMG 22485 / NCIMB 9086 / R18194 / 383) TaxID=482957 RepID=A0A6P2KKD1_BURL3|nr:IclR family regulatory protein [Burkholderia lata]